MAKAPLSKCSDLTGNPHLLQTGVAAIRLSAAPSDTNVVPLLTPIRRPGRKHTFACRDVSDTDVSGPRRLGDVMTTVMGNLATAAFCRGDQDFYRVRARVCVPKETVQVYSRIGSLFSVCRTADNVSIEKTAILR